MLLMAVNGDIAYQPLLTRKIRQRTRWVVEDASQPASSTDRSIRIEIRLILLPSLLPVISLMCLVGLWDVAVSRGSTEAGVKLQRLGAGITRRAAPRVLSGRLHRNQFSFQRCD